MVMLPSQFRTEDHGEMLDFEPIPVGDYLAKVVQSSLETAKSGRGSYLKLVFEVLTPKFKGRKLFVNLNIINDNPQAVEIANRELSSICLAAGKPAIRDSNELHGIPMKIKVTIKPDSRGENYPPQNRITKYSSLELEEAAAPEEGEIQEQKKLPWD